MRVAIISMDTVASKGEAVDTAGESVRDFLRDEGASIVSYAILACDRRAVASEICNLADHYRADIIFTVGRTGIGSGDIAPDVTYDVIEMEVPGIGEAMRACLMQDWPESILSRATAGVRQETLIINLWGEQAAIAAQLGSLWNVLPKAKGLLRGRGWLGEAKSR